MPKVRRSRKRPPDGWELIEPTLDELDQKMREGAPLDSLYRIPCYDHTPFTAEVESHEGKRKVEALWPIFK